MLYFFLLLSQPVAPACVLWIDRPPVSNDYLPPVCPLMEWVYFDLRLLDADGAVLCTWPAVNGGLMDIPCDPSPAGNYRIEVWDNGLEATGCNLWLPVPEYTAEDIADSCPEWLDEYNAGRLTVQGPFEIRPPVQPAPACTLPQVDNSAPIATSNEYEFLAGRLAWWGLDISPLEWQNRFDEKIRGAADAAGVPARLLKGMLANESQFWPLWTGDAGETGWMQITWDGADTALRHNPDLFRRYCPLALWLPSCSGYDLLTDRQQTAVRSALVADLSVSGTPLEVADQAADDLWTYANVLRAYACQAAELYPNRDVWQSAAVLYNAGTACIQGGVVCPQGQKYLDEVMK